jgi:uncharacterized protein YbjT (DUF2867 family)
MILVTGASGRIGTAVIRDLAARSLPVRALARARTRSPLRDCAGLEWAEGDLGDERSVSAAVEGVDSVVLHSAPSPEQIGLQERFIDVAIAAGVRRIIKLSVAGAAADAACDGARRHWRVEQCLEGADVEWCSVRATRPMQDLLHQVPLLLTSGLLAGCQGTGQSADVDVRDIGSVLSSLAAAAQLHHGVLPLTGPEALDGAEMARQLARHFNRPVRYVDCSPGDLLQCAQAAGVEGWQAHDLVAWQTEARDGRYSIVYDTVERVTGREPRRFEAFANELAMSLRYSNAPQRAQDALAGIGS